MLDPVLTQLLTNAVSLAVGFVANYTLERIKERRKNLRISWDAKTEKGFAGTHPDLREAITVNYRGRRVESLTAVTCKIENTGMGVVKNERIRFEFPRSCTILDASLDPEPQREIAAARTAVDEIGPWEAIYDIGHLEKRQSVTVKLLSDGQAGADWKVFAHNEQGDVEFQSRDVLRERDDRQHVVPFLTYLALIVVVAIISSISLASGAIQFVTGPLEIVLGILALPHIVPAARWLRDSSSAAASAAYSANTTSGAVIQAASITGLELYTGEARGGDQPADEES